MPVAYSGTPHLGTITGVNEFCVINRSSNQAINLGVGDHVMFNSLTGFRGGQYIQPDLLTTYSNVQGAASIGRITLKAGPAYYLQYMPGLVLVDASGSFGTFTFHNATDGLNFGGFYKAVPVSQTTHVNYGTTMATIIEPTKDILVEVRIIAVTGTITGIGEGTAANPTLLIYTI